MAVNIGEQGVINPSMVEVRDIESAQEVAAFELRIPTTRLPVIRFLTDDITVAGRQLGEAISQNQAFFANAPVVVDVAAFRDELAAELLPSFVGILRSFGTVPFAICKAGDAVNETALALDMGVLPDSAFGVSRKRQPEEEVRQANTPASASSAPESQLTAETTVIEEPLALPQLHSYNVRSGSIVEVGQTDLSIIGKVSSGAEIRAGGNIHIYGTLYGVARAGEGGNEEARIFCKEFQPEYVAIAGHVRAREDIPDAVIGTSVQVFLDHGTLRIEKL